MSSTQQTAVSASSPLQLHAPLGPLLIPPALPGGVPRYSGAVPGNAASLGGLTVGLVLVLLVYSGGPTSGGHYNPAVSFACLLRGALGLGHFLGYAAVQIVGAALVQIAGYADMPSEAICANEPCNTPSMPAPCFKLVGRGTAAAMGSALVAEFTWTLLWAFAVINCLCSHKAQGNAYFGLAVGLVNMFV
eukprot:gene4181-105_t